jgi:hypothetical protein
MQVNILLQLTYFYSQHSYSNIFLQSTYFYSQPKSTLLQLTQVNRLLHTSTYFCIKQTFQSNHHAKWKKNQMLTSKKFRIANSYRNLNTWKNFFFASVVMHMRTYMSTTVCGVVLCLYLHVLLKAMEKEVRRYLWLGWFIFLFSPDPVWKRRFRILQQQFVPHIVDDVNRLKKK